ncbi:TetR family transcriptional regulator [Ornithinicoccus hortensis]|uniref:TetR family transcriptional regulator n=1 Tax=Ornithinicoccus hortensis TaxID=82346 RepID=UPI0011528C4E|nr:TetR family transcriptional regulator [Ornithinicoccus hortensis]
MTSGTRVGGRPPRIDRADIVRAGRALGMAGLSVKAVAAELGVSATALYRHVDGRWGLERLVGESLLSDLVHG